MILKKSIQTTVMLLLILETVILTTCKKPEREMKVTIVAVTNITSNSAEVSSNIDDLGEGVIQHGHCYSKSHNPETDDNRTPLGAPVGTGPFEDQLTNLDAGTEYFVRAYLYNGKEPEYSKEEKRFTTLQSNPPLFVSAVIENATPTLLEITYSLTLANVVPTVSAFTVTVNSASRNVSSVAISGAKVQLTLASAVIYGDVVTVAYTKPATNPLQTSAGGQAASITAQSVTNNVAAPVPVFVSAAVENATPTLLEMTYNLALISNGTPASAFTVMVNSVARSVNTVTINGTKVSLTLASAVAYGDIVTVAYTKPATNPLQTSSGGQAATITAQSVTNNVNSLLTVTDIEGNVYNTVTIGSQTWMKENLKTRKYNDNTNIPNVTNNTEWEALTTLAYCWYNNDKSTYGDVYGALYNWYAVNTGKLCPTGWHVPTDAEWTTMENYLIANGFNYDGTTTGNKIAKALASTSLWASSSEIGVVGNTDYPAKRNITGFTALPGGYRSYSGTFTSIGNYGFWWSSSESSATSAWYWYVFYGYSYVGRSYAYKQLGFSVRCLRD